MVLSKSQVFLYCCLMFIFGIGLASFFPASSVGHSWWWFWLMMISVVISVLFRSGQKIRTAAWLGLFLFLGMWRYAISLPIDAPDKIWHYNGETAAVLGTVVNEPDIRIGNENLEVRSEKIIKSGKEHNVSGKILLTTGLYPEYGYGDKLKITGDLRAPKEFQGFAYDRYLARRRIYSVFYYPQIVRLKEGGGYWFYRRIFFLKNKLRAKINSGLGEPAAGLARAIVLGDKKGIPNDLRRIFSRAGISHIIAISGLHISIMSAILLWLLLCLGLWRRQAFWLAGLFLFFYIILIGLPASAVRAGIMGFLVLWALNAGRLNRLSRSLVLAGAVLLLFNPRLLRDDIGFQLSFLAVFGIVYVYPLLDNVLEAGRKRLPQFWRKRKAAAIVKGILAITAAAQIFTMPLVAYHFSQISFVAPLANLAVLWILPVLITAILAALGLSFVFPGWVVVFFLPSRLILGYITGAAGLAASVPGGYLEVDYVWIGWIVLWYAGWIGTIYWLRRKK